MVIRNSEDKALELSQKRRWWAKTQIESEIAGCVTDSAVPKENLKRLHRLTSNLVQASWSRSLHTRKCHARKVMERIWNLLFAPMILSSFRITLMSKISVSKSLLLSINWPLHILVLQCWWFRCRLIDWRPTGVPCSERSHASSLRQFAQAWTLKICQGQSSLSKIWRWCVDLVHHYSRNLEFLVQWVNCSSDPGRTVCVLFKLFKENHGF